MDIAGNFAAILDDAVSRSDEIMTADISALPGFYKPHAKEWNTVPDCKYADVGLAVYPGFIRAAEEYSDRMWRRRFAECRLNDQVFAILMAPTPIVIDVKKKAARESELRGNLKRAFASASERINKMSCEESEEVNQVIADLNDISAKLSKKTRNTYEDT